MAATDSQEVRTPDTTQVLSCSRVGCNAPASAVFSFDAAASLVWLDRVTGPNEGAGLLCDAHADRMTPPRGWNLQDRRGPTPRLWVERPAPTPDRIGQRRERVTRSRPRVGVPASLPFDDDARWTPRARPGPDLEHLLDARTPLLARAFEAAREPKPPT